MTAGIQTLLMAVVVVLWCPYVFVLLVMCVLSVCLVIGMCVICLPGDRYVSVLSVCLMIGMYVYYLSAW